MASLTALSRSRRPRQSGRRPGRPHESSRQAGSCTRTTSNGRGLGSTAENTCAAFSDVASVDEQLTPQELSIALAASEGLTNKEIAARLFLSPKTVEFHLGHAYRKLNVRSRGELIKLFAVQAAPVARLQA